MNLCKAVKIRLIDIDIKQNVLAGRVGVSSAYISTLLNGRKPFTWTIILSLSSALEMRASELISSAEMLD